MPHGQVIRCETSCTSIPITVRISTEFGVTLFASTMRNAIANGKVSDPVIQKNVSEKGRKE
jgi:hypothetical protein